MNKRILHIRDMAGVSRLISKYQRKLGYQSDTIDFRYNKYDFGIDYYFPKKTFLPSGLEFFYYLLKISKDYNIFHFHAITTSLKGFDIPFWKYIKNKKVIMHYHGSRIRGKKEKFFYKNFPDRIFVSTPDLLKYVNNGIWIPNPADLEILKFVGIKKDNEKIRILHPPSRRLVKGTKYVIKSIKILKEEGYNIDFLLVENTPHKELLEIMKTSDIVIDWINPSYGIYGMVSIEAMALGKPVICSINNEFINKYYNDLPIMNADYENLVKKIRYLIEDYSLRKKLSKNGRNYIEKKHNGRIIAKKIVSYY